MARSCGDRARLSGLNIIGMQRRGFTREEIQALRNAYQLLFIPRAPSAIGSMRLRIASPGMRRSRILSQFIRADSSSRYLSAQRSEWRIACGGRARLGIVAGGGGLPRRLVETCRATGREVFVLALEGAADHETVADVPHAWCPIGAAGRGLGFAARE